VNPTFVKEFTKDLYALQDKRLLGAEELDIALLSVKTRSERYTLINQNGEWVLEDRPAEKLNQQVVNLLVSRVANVPAEERVLKQAGPLAPYGLVNPVAEFVATGRDGKVTGKLLIGDQANGLAFASGHRLPGIYQIRSDLLQQIPPITDLVAGPGGSSG
jgi:hypothetical protein